MNSKKKPVVKSLSTKPKKRIVRDASPAPDLPLDGTQRKLAEGALQDDRAGMEKVIEKAKINKEKRAAEMDIANKELAFKITEHEQAEETIRSLARFPSENPNPVLRIARDGNLLYGNPAAFTLLKKWKLRVGKPAPEVLKNLTNEALETETTKMVDIPCGDRIFSISIAPAPKGEYINLYARDVTERKQAEEELRESEALLNEVGVIAKVGGWEMDITTGKATWSKGTYDIVEIDYNKPVPGLHEHVGYYLPEYREMIERKMNALIETKQPMKFEAELKTAKGNIKWCQALGEAVVKDGKLIKLRGTFQDITERKRMEEALTSSEQFLSNVIEQSPVSLWISDSEGTLIKMNQACRELFGTTDEEAVGKYNLRKDNLIEAQGFMALVGDVFEKGEIARFTIDYDLPRVEHIEVKEGTHRILDVVISPIKDIHGKLTNVLVQHKDITELKQAEEQIKQLNAELESTVEKRTAQLSETLDLNQKMIEASSIGIFACRADGPCIIANPAMGRISGAPVEKMLQLNFRELKNWKENGLFDMAEAVLATGKQQRSESHLTTTFGRDVWLDYYFTTFTSNGGLHFLMLVDDITERKQAEQALQQRTAQLQTANKQLESELTERKRAEAALRESDERFRSLAGAAFEAINIHDGGVLLDANEQYYAMFGYKPEELLGKQVMTLTIAPEAMETVKKEIATGGVGPYESTGLRKDGTRLPMEIRVREMEYKGRKVRMAAIMDITEHKLAEQALQQWTTQLEAANQELEAFSYSISHDLRSPLRAMDGFSRILLEEYASQLPAEAQRYLGLVRDNAKQMGHLIEDLLAFSRLSRLPLYKQTVAMAEVVQKALAELSAEQEGRNVEVTIGDLPVCEADPALLKQVWVNLLSNAFKFTRKRKNAHIEIGAKQTGAECIYFIKDNGVGFDMQYVDKLFGVFQRLHRSEEYEGTGVGLAIVQRIVHRHGGGAWAEAEVDKGAAFYFTLGGGT